MEGRHRAAVAAQVAPYIEGEIVSGVVIGIVDGGKREIYGFGAGPGGTPDGATLFELGTLTSVYTGLLLADAVQRQEVTLDTALVDLMPTGVTVPAHDKTVITLRHLVLHSSGLPRHPPSVDAHTPDPYGGYDEDRLFRDLARTDLDDPPGTRMTYSTYGIALLGYGLGRKIGGGYGKVLQARVLDPLELRDTFVAVPAALDKRRAAPSTVDLAPAAAQTWTDATGGAGMLVSSARDQLRFLEAQLDAAAGGKTALRGAMRFAQESQLEAVSAGNLGLGWMIDARGRYQHEGATRGSHAFAAFDPKNRRGVVVLAATGTTLVDRLGQAMIEVLEGTAKPPPPLPTESQLAAYAGTYDLAGTRLAVVVAGKRLYLEGPGEPRHRLVPITNAAFWIEALQSVAVFQRDGEQITRVVFAIGDRQMSAPRVP
jgi:CubicO group peptidase (beta-lactamase class C family)